MSPVLALSPTSPSYQCQSSSRRNSVSETTPKLPRRERLASFSRLEASKNLLGQLPEKSRNGGGSRRTLKGRQIVLEKVPSVRVSPCTPPHYSNFSPESTSDAFVSSQISTEYLNSNQLPFSPDLLSCKSPKYLSPNYKYPTPTKSPLYSYNHQSLFLGRGSFGKVTLCAYKDSKFALKVIHSRGSAGERNLIGIRHPHLVSVLHIAQVSDKILICMEFAGHCNLQQVLDTKSELDFLRRLSFCVQIASGLRHCHLRRIVHADVKPANVIVSPYGICKLGDFGHSISLNSNELVSPNEEVIGTAAYAAPEVLRGSRPTLASDMYSFGILLWQVQTRELPFAGEHPHVVIYKVAHYGVKPAFAGDGTYYPGKYSAITKMCWSDEPRQRLNASQALEELQSLMHKMKAMNGSLQR